MPRKRPDPSRPQLQVQVAQDLVQLSDAKIVKTFKHHKAARILLSFCTSFLSRCVRHIEA